ncbi:Acyltransferase [Aphelenchoides fujianensis]|nr:Acyltransferase [Aphelenchoides fujianensis]
MSGGVKQETPEKAADFWFKPSTNFDSRLPPSRFVFCSLQSDANNNRMPRETSVRPAFQPTVGKEEAAHLQQEARGRLQSFLEATAVAIYVFGFVFAPFVLTAFSLLILVCPPLWVLAVPYGVWCFFDGKTPMRGSRFTRFFRTLRLWTYMARYFPMKLVKTADFPADRNYIVGCHPHGILSFSTFLPFCTEAVGFSEAFPELERRYAVTLPVQYWFPIRRVLLLLTSTIDSEVGAIEHVLQTSEKATVVAMVLNGAAEALDPASDCFTLTLKSRKGFVKLALQNGASLVPSYSFGETSAFKQILNTEGSWLREFQKAFKCFTGVSLPFFYGCGFLPFRTPITLVFGRPIHVPKVAEPTSAQINELHEKYCRELVHLFDAHKQKCGVPRETQLEFF